MFLVDDFGRERVSPDQLLNRFITPMEYHIDYFTLRTGQKIQIPLHHVLIVATNLSPEKVTDPAFLRRMGYRALPGSALSGAVRPDFSAVCPAVRGDGRPRNDRTVAGALPRQNRELRGCEPRDLIERARDVCRFQGKPLELTSKVLDLAWTGYFGEQKTEKDKADAEIGESKAAED